MTAEDYKMLARRAFAELANTGNMALVDELVAQGFVRHDLGGGPDIRGPQGVKLFVAALRTAFPDIETTVEDIIAEGDKVVVRFTARGTHKGTFQGIAPTGRQFTITGINIYRIEAGKAAETWQLMDALGLMQQLGVVTLPADASAQAAGGTRDEGLP